MTKRAFNIVISLLLLSMLVLFVLVFQNRQITSVTITQQPSSVAQTTTAENMQAPLTTTQIATTTVLEEITGPNQALVPTPLPDRGIHLSEWQPLVLQGGDADYLQLRTLVATDKIVAAVSMTNTQRLGSTIITIDLTSGLVQRITKFGPPRILYMHASENRIVWSEQLTSPQIGQISMEALHVYDLKSKTESIVVPEGYFQMMHYKHGLAVWEGELNGVQGIHGYNFNTNKLFTIEVSTDGHLATLARACSNNWVIYLVTSTYELPTQAELHVRNLTNGEDFVLGAVRIPNVVNYTDTTHDCDGNRVVWLETSISGQQQVLQKVKLYDLTMKLEQLIELPEMLFAVELNGSVVTTGQPNGLSYDVERKIAFDLGANYIKSASAGQDVRTEETIAQDRWIQLQEGIDGRPTIYTAKLVRNP